MSESPLTSAPISATTKRVTIKAGGQRVATIDILRALTMVLMVFVNDLWSLTGIPSWLGHVDAGVDGMGLSDVVFPAFVFIVGLSIPYAFENRRKRGDTDRDLVKHVLVRTIALLVMGVFLVNGESINAAATGMPRGYWGPICCLCFILIWNAYPSTTKPAVKYGLRTVAILTLIGLAVIYRGGPDDALHYFGPQWWGILGLIGWAYLAGGLIAVFAHDNFRVIGVSWFFFSALSIMFHLGWVPEILSFVPTPIRGGTLTGLTLGGIMTAMIFRHYRTRGDNKTLSLVLLGFSLLLIGLSLITRPYWGLSKLAETPAWLFLCSALTIIAFVVVYWIADMKQKAHWFAFLKPAGVATLLCYLVPHFAYFAKRVAGISLPDFMLYGGIGLLKSLLFALLCVFVTGVLIRVGIKLKL